MDLPNSERRNLGLRAFLEAFAFFSPAQVLSPMVMSCFLLFSFAFFPESGVISFLSMPRSRVALAITRGGFSMGVGACPFFCSL